MASDQFNENGTVVAKGRLNIAIPCLTVAFAAIGFGLVGWSLFKESGEQGSQLAAESPVLCREAVWDFGTIDQNQQSTVTHVFKLENTTAKTIRVAKVDASCGCVVPDKDLTALQANSAADFRVGMRTAGRPAGPFQNVVHIKFETSPPTEITAVIKGVIPANPALYIIPSNLSFGTVVENSTASRTIKVARHNRAPVRFLKASAESPGLKLVNVTPGDAADSFVELTVTLDGSKLEKGDFESNITVQTQDPKFRDLRVFATAKVVPKSLGFVASLFIDRLPAKGFVDKKLANADQFSSPVKAILYEGDEAISVQFLKNIDMGDGRRIPMVRVSRSDRVAKHNTIVRGNLILVLVGITDNLRIPVAAYLSD